MTGHTFFKRLFEHEPTPRYMPEQKSIHSEQSRRGGHVSICLDKPELANHEQEPLQRAFITRVAHFGACLSCSRNTHIIIIIIIIIIVIIIIIIITIINQYFRHMSHTSATLKQVQQHGTCTAPAHATGRKQVKARAQSTYCSCSSWAAAVGYK